MSNWKEALESRVIITMTCKTCQFFVKKSGSTEHTHGVCIRYPPVATAKLTVWPRVGGDEVCGEWKAPELAQQAQGPQR